MKKYTKEELLKNFTLIFLFLFPITGLKIFHNHITNLIVVSIISIILLLTIILIKDSRKKLRYLIGYYVICLIHLFILYFRSKNFNTLIPNEFDLFKEALTILKLIMPISLLYSLYYQKINKKEYFTIIKSWIIFIAGSIVISNIFKISLSSYGEQHITKSIFEWGKNIYYVYTASKGYFMYANQVASTLLLLLIITVYNFFTSNKKDILYILIITFAMLMLGTRVSTLGGLLTLICLFIAYILFCIIQKNKISKYSYLILIPITIWISLIPISPYSNRNIELTTTTAESGDTYYEKVGFKDENDKIQYVYDNYPPEKLPSVFFEYHYPIQYDTSFWYNLIKTTPNGNINYRFIEKSIIERMWEIDENKINVLFGISNSRIQNVINLERDILLHYYSYGIIGSIVVLFIYLYLLITTFNQFIKKKDFLSFTSFSIILLFLFTSYLTGNIINSLFTIIIFSFIAINKNVVV